MITMTRSGAVPSVGGSCFVAGAGRRRRFIALRPRARHGDHQSGSSSSSTSASTASIQGEEDPGAAGVLSGTPQQELEQAHPRPINRPEEVTNMQLSSRLDPQHTSIGSRGSPSPAAFPMSPAPGATPGTLTKSMNDCARYACRCPLQPGHRTG